MRDRTSMRSPGTASCRRWERDKAITVKKLSNVDETLRRGIHRKATPHLLGTRSWRLRYTITSLMPLLLVVVSNATTLRNATWRSSVYSSKHLGPALKPGTIILRSSMAYSAIVMSHGMAVRSQHDGCDEPIRGRCDDIVSDLGQVSPRSGTIKAMPCNQI